MEALTPEQEIRLEREVAALECAADEHDLKGETAAALSLKRAALALQESVLGPEHPDVATSLDMLAISLYKNKHYAEAEKLFRRALAIYKRFPEAPEELAISYEWLAWVYDDQKQWRKALTHWHDALLIHKRCRVNDSLEVSRNLSIYADLLRVTGRKVRARATLRRAAAMRAKAQRLARRR